MNMLTPREVSKYFLYLDMWKIVLQLLFWSAVTAALGFLFEMASIYIVTFVMLGVALYFYIGCLRDVPSDHEIDYQFELLTEKFKVDAVNRFDLRKDDLISEVYCVISKSPGIKNSKIRSRWGRDHIKRSNTKTFECFIFCKQRFMTYEVDYNIEDETESAAVTSEYSYKDILTFESDDKGAYDIRGAWGVTAIPTQASSAVIKVRDMLRDQD